MLTNKKIEQMIGMILLIGTLISTAFVATGGMLYLIQEGSQPIHLDTWQAGDAPTTLKSIWQDTRALTPLGIIECGLLFLVITQILRVALLTCFYALIRDYWFTFISAFILLTLLYSFIWRQ